MNNPTGLNPLDMMALGGLMGSPTTRRDLRSSTRMQTNGKNTPRSKQRKKNRVSRKSRARNRS